MELHEVFSDFYGVDEDDDCAGPERFDPFDYVDVVDDWDDDCAEDVQESFVICTIENGTITIDGKAYRPDERFMKYDGRLDGMRYAFGLYDGENFVSLWGTEECYNDPEHFKWGPEVVDDSFPWVWWRTDGHTN